MRIDIWKVSVNGRRALFCSASNLGWLHSPWLFSEWRGVSLSPIGNYSRSLAEAGSSVRAVSMNKANWLQYGVILKGTKQACPIISLIL